MSITMFAAFEASGFDMSSGSHLVKVYASEEAAKAHVARAYMGGHVCKVEVELEA